MNHEDRLHLKKMIQVNNVEDYTKDIRIKKHSELIKKDVLELLNIKKYNNYLQNNFDDIAIPKCNFLFTNYTDIYNKVKKEEININTLFELLNILKNIEDEKIDQHEGSYEVGKLLKKIYVDTAIMKADTLDINKDIQLKSHTSKNISWSEYKKSIM